MKRYFGKTVLISQADSEMGQALAQKYSNEGANLVLIGKQKVEGDNILSIDSGFLSVKSAQEILNEAVTRFTRIDVLIINNISVERSSIESATSEWIQKQMDQNCRPYFIATKVIGAHMVSAGNGKILFVSSVHAEKPTGSAFAFSMAKGAVGMLCKEAALTLGRKNVQVNEVLLDALEGEEELFQSDTVGFHYTQETKIPRKRSGTPVEITPLCAFLTSAEADFINGSSVRIDGGHYLYYIDR